MSIFGYHTDFKPNPFNAFNPLSISWYLAFWGNDPNWVPPANGAGVATAPDATGNGHNFTQATGSKQGLYQAASANLNWRRTILFDTVDDFMVTAAFGAALSDPTEMFIVGRMSTTGGTRCWCDGITQSSHSFQANAALWRITNGTAQTSAVATDTTKHAIRVVWDVTDELWLDGTRIVNADAGTRTLAGLTLNSRFLVDSQYAGMELEFIGLKSGLLTATERTNLLGWARSYCGTP